MRRWLLRAAFLYPGVWRRRYGCEFEALLDDIEPGWGDIWDVLRGAMEMQMATWSVARAAGTVGLAGALIAAGLTLRMPHRYRATGTVETAGGVGDRVEGLKREVLSNGFLAAVIHSEDLCKAERQNTSMVDIEERMRRENIGIAAAAGGTLRVSFLDEDPARAQRVAHWIQNQMVSLHRAELRAASLPALPNTSIPPSRWPFIGYGLAAGLLIGGFASYLRRQPWRWTLRMAAFLMGGTLLGLGFYYSWWYGLGPGSLLFDHFTSSATLLTTDAPALQTRIERPDVLQEAIRAAGLHLTADLLRRDLRIVRVPSLSGDLLTVSVTYTDRYKAQRALNSMLDSAAASARLALVDPPVVPEQGQFSLWHFLTVGMLLGMGAGLIRRRLSFVPQLRPA